MSPATPLHERLRESLPRLLELRVSLGGSADTYRHLLTPFADYVEEAWPGETLVTPEVVDGWLDHHAYPTPNSQYVFVCCLRGLCGFLRFEGSDDFVPDEDYTVRRVDRQPHLFTDDELVALFLAIDSYVGKGGGKRFLPELVLPVWSRLLYCCGMRPGEPPSLLREDVDLSTGDVYIRQSKRHKDRHIIVSDDMRDLMARYDALSDADRTLFFERWDGKPYDARWYRNAWDRALASSDVDWGELKPRPYDLRHAFCSRNIVRWMDEGGDEMELMPVLSAYVGHSELQYTMYYIHLLPERLRRSPGVDWDSLSVTRPGGGAS